MKSEDVRNLATKAEAEDGPLIAALKSAVPSFHYAYVIDWIPEQGSSIYVVVVSDRQVATIEIFDSGLPEVSLTSLLEYRRQHPNPGVETRRKLAAIERLI